jgi:hypothetical protein
MISIDEAREIADLLETGAISANKAARLAGINPNTFASRLYAGEDTIEALTRPLAPGRSHAMEKLVVHKRWHSRPYLIEDVMEETGLSWGGAYHRLHQYRRNITQSEANLLRPKEATGPQVKGGNSEWASLGDKERGILI